VPGEIEIGLDEDVHDLASSLASDIDNLGLEEQARYLLAHNSPATVEAMIRQAAS
jgi:hypothetical protein